MVALLVAPSALFGVAPAQASDCGTLRFHGKRLIRFAEGVSCTRARRVLHEYVAADESPKGYYCRGAGVFDRPTFEEVQVGCHLNGHPGRRFGARVR